MFNYPFSPATLKVIYLHFRHSEESDETYSVDSVATNLRITYAIAMNNRMVQEGCSSSGSDNSGASSGSVDTNAASEPSAAEEEATVARYPKRVRREVNYNGQLNPTEDVCYICKYICCFYFPRQQL